MPTATSPAPSDAAATALLDLNLAVLRGTLSSAPREQVLASGDRLVSLELTARSTAGPADSVPVAWFGAPAKLPVWDAGQELLVIGKVRRRFFRTATGTASRTEVVASSVLPTNRRAAIDKAIAVALAAVHVSAAGATTGSPP